MANVTKNPSRQWEAYIPRLLAEALSSADSESVPLYNKYYGIVVFIDITGFTSLTTRLTTLGHSGPELLANLLDRYFGGITNLVFGLKGDVLKFAGDAIWVYLPDNTDILHFCFSVKQFLDSLRLNPEFHVSPETDLSLGVHIGAEEGAFGLASMGAPGDRVEAEPVGALITTALSAADLAAADELVLGPVLAARLTRMNLNRKQGTIFHSVLMSSIDTGAADVSHADISHLPAFPDSVLEQYLPWELRNSDTDQRQHEFRKVGVMFVNFQFESGISGDVRSTDIQRLNSVLTNVFTKIRDTGGTVSRIDPASEGHKLLVLYGAPVKHRDDIRNAVSTAATLLKMQSNFCMFRIGLTTGSLFCGEVGGPYRKEYTVLGESINRSARLMTSADWGQFLFDSDTRATLPKYIRSEPVELHLKGFSGTSTCYRFTQITHDAREIQAPTHLVGRDELLVDLQRAIRNPVSGDTTWIGLTGETGCGKTAVLGALAEELSEHQVSYLPGRDTLFFDSGWPIRMLLVQLLRTEEDALYELVSNRIQSAWLPLLSEILLLEIPENEWTAGLSPNLRREKLISLVSDLVEAYVTDRALLMIDDFDLLDEQSRELLTALNLPQHSCSIVATSTDPRILQGKESSRYLTIALGNPIEPYWRRYLDTHFTNGKREQELIDLLLDGSSGNPRIIGQFITRMEQDKTIVRSSATDKFECRKPVSEIRIPESVSELHLAEFDQLPGSYHAILKAASLSTGSFTPDLIAALPDMPPPAAIERAFSELQTHGILEKTLSAEYRFTQASMRSAILECIPHSQVKSWHSGYAAFLKQSSPDAIHRLALHYDGAEEWQDAFKYLLAAAELSTTRFSINEASGLFDRCHDILSIAPRGVIRQEDAFRLFERHVEFLNLIGEFHAILMACVTWKRVARQSESVEQLLKCAVRVGHVLSKQSRYDRADKVLRYVLRYPESDRFAYIGAETLTILAEIERRRGDFDKAIEYCQNAIEKTETLGLNEILADAYNNMGLALWGEGRLDEAAVCYQKCLSLGSMHGGKFAEAQTANNLAIIYWEKGSITRADDMMSNAIEIFRMIGDRRNQAYASGNLATIKRISGEYTTSRQLYQWVDETLTSLGDEHAHMYTVGNIADLDLLEGNIGKAHEAFTRVLEFAATVGDKELAAECKIRLGDVYFYSGDIDAARETLTKGIEEAESIGSSEYEIRGKVALCRLMILKRETEAVSPVISDIYEKGHKSSSQLICNESSFLTGEVHRLRGDIEEAVQHFQQVKSYAQIEGVFELSLKSAVRLFELDHASRENARELLAASKAKFISDNGAGAWSRLVISPYFNFFTSSLLDAVGA